MADLSKMPHQTLVKLIQEILAEAITAEDAGDCLLSICDRFGVQPNGDLSQIANLKRAE